MPQLYSISFTPKILTTVIGKRGKIEQRVSNPIVMHALPYPTAMSYKTAGAENFKIWPYVMEDRYQSKGSGRDDKVGNGTKRAPRATTEAVVAAKSVAKPKPAVNSAVKDASTGNLSAALN